MTTPLSSGRFDPEDPRLTAYALGELPEDEMREIQEVLKNSPEARNALAQTLATVGALTGALEAEAAAVTTPAGSKDAVTWGRSRWWLAAAGVAAVCLSIVAFNNGLDARKDGAPGRNAPAGRESAEAPVPDNDVDDLETLSLLGATPAKLPADSRADPSPNPIPITRPNTSATSPGTSTRLPRLRVVDAKRKTEALSRRTPTAPGKARKATRHQITSRRFGDLPGATLLTDGAFYNEGRDGDVRARVEQTLERELSKLGDNEKKKGFEQADWVEDARKSEPHGKASGEAAHFKVRLVEAQQALDASRGAHESALAAKKLAEIVRFARPHVRNEAYDPIFENDFLSPTNAPLSTFSLDVDTASYANVRRFLTSDQAPPRHAVRVEELVNYFRYDDPAPGPDSEHPVAITTESAPCFWNLNHKLVRIGVKARDIPFGERPASNFVFLIDVSGSMQPENKLPLLKKAFRLLVDNLGENDRVAIVVYASATGLVLPSTSCDQKETILQALENLSAGGSTNGGAGIQLAYDTAVRNLIPGGNNRVILATDGDFNVGVTDRGDLIDRIQAQARSGVFLSILGFGQGNLKDATMEQLADKGNGNYSYIDSVDEAQKVLVREMGGTLLTVAKDVKLQVEFNPARVAGYRLIGYENRMLAAKDFNDDTKDAGELGAGHSVCALYEVVPANQPAPTSVDPLRYQTKPGLTDEALGQEMLTVKLRYKDPTASRSVLMSVPLTDKELAFDAASPDLRWSSAVAAFGLLLRGSAYAGTASFPGILEVCASAIGDDPHGDRRGFIALIVKASQLGSW